MSSPIARSQKPEFALGILIARLRLLPNEAPERGFSIPRWATPSHATLTRAFAISLDAARGEAVLRGVDPPHVQKWAAFFHEFGARLNQYSQTLSSFPPVEALSVARLTVDVSTPPLGRADARQRLSAWMECFELQGLSSCAQRGLSTPFARALPWTDNDEVENPSFSLIFADHEAHALAQVARSAQGATQPNDGSGAGEADVDIGVPQRTRRL